MKIYNTIIIAACALIMATSCISDLDSSPIDPNVTTGANVYDDEANYKLTLAKVYAVFATTGQQGPSGQSDIAVSDEGEAAYLRQLFYHQVFTTDEAVVGWNNPGISDFHNLNWTASNGMVTYMYDRIMLHISYANEYIRQVQPRLGSLSGSLATDVKYFLAEARFLRAYSYYNAMDLFANPPFATESDPVSGSFFPPQTNRAKLFEYIESELLDIIDNNNDVHLMAAKTNEYGRADKAAAWTLLARMYLNAPVFTGKTDNKYYTDCITYCQKVIDAGYSLWPSYAEMFMADNHRCTSEVIFPVPFDGNHTQTYGGTTFIISAAIGGEMTAADYGTTNRWSGTRTTSALVGKFDSGDRRAMWFTEDQALEISNVSLFTDGYAVTKWTNMTSTGNPGSHSVFVDTDWPLFRLADVYLMYAEAVVRGGSGGSATTALAYVNEIRTRAYGDNSGNITTTDMSLDFILDERARELYWEGYRRADLVRYGRLTTGDYLWPWKGGVKEGQQVRSIYNIFPIPSSDLSANTNLKQNTGY